MKSNSTLLCSCTGAGGDTRGEVSRASQRRCQDFRLWDLQLANARLNLLCSYWISGKASPSFGVPIKEMGIIAAAVKS